MMTTEYARGIMSTLVPGVSTTRNMLSRKYRAIGVLPTHRTPAHAANAATKAPETFTIIGERVSRAA
jgi:hypothetical protein